MKRYLISPIIGDGKSLQTSFRAAVSDVTRGVVNLIPSRPDGTPKYRFAFCLVSTDVLPQVLAVSNVYALPDYNLDGRMDGMEADARTAMGQSVAAYDLDGNGLHLDPSNADADSYRTVLTRIARQIEPAFDLNAFDVA
jgi:hypothetical protein